MPPVNSDDGSLRWDLRRNCRLTPGQLLAGCGTLVLVLLVLGTVFALLGFGWVTVFAGLDIAAIAVALLVYVRHAADRETLVLRAGELHVEQHDGPHCRRLVMPAAGARVEAPAQARALVALRGPGGAEVRVGRHLRPHDRRVLAQQLRRALMAAA